MSISLAGDCQDEITPASIPSSPEGNTDYFSFLFYCRKLGMLIVRGLYSKRLYLYREEVESTLKCLFSQSSVATVFVC